MNVMSRDGGRPRIGISRCLLGDEVRYDGGHKRDALLISTQEERRLHDQSLRDDFLSRVFAYRCRRLAIPIPIPIPNSNPESRIPNPG